MTSPQISLLADYPQYIATLAPWVLDHWRQVLPDMTLQDRISRFQQHLNRDALPIAWVAHADGQVMGTAALRVSDLPGREDLTPWLGGVYVAPAYRNRGLGQALCQTVERQARALFGTQTLYLFTLDRQAWYAGFGWQAREPCQWSGHRGDIMTKNLGDS